MNRYKDPVGIGMWFEVEPGWLIYGVSEEEALNVKSACHEPLQNFTTVDRRFGPLTKI